MKPAIAVIGAGVIGLTTAIRLLEEGWPVTILARDLAAKMASRAAPAFWHPYNAGPEDAILRWSAYSLAVFKNLPAATGVTPIDMLELFREDPGLPLWTKVLTPFRECSAPELGASYVRGFAVRTYLIDTSIYMDYLVKRFKNLNGRFEQQTLTHLTDTPRHYEVVINCSGLGAYELVPDPTMFPIRGQWLSVSKNPAITKITMTKIDTDNYILVVPRAHDCYIGGTTRHGNWDTATDNALSNTIFVRAQQFEPLLKTTTLLHSGVGLRPGRTTVRLEKALLSDGRMVIHDYGHGGSGFTVSWGCAADVLNLLT